MLPEVRAHRAGNTAAAVRMMRNALAFIALALLAGGCSWFSWLPWVDDDKDDEKAKLEPAKLVKFDAEVKIDRLWKAQIGDGLGKKYMRLPPAILADMIFAADGYGDVEAHNRFTGKRIWRVQVDKVQAGMLSSLNLMDRTDPSFLTGGVGAGAGMVLVGTSDGVVIALAAADGTERWRVHVGSEILAPPVTGGKEVFVQAIDGRLLALEEDTGAVRWSFDNQVPVLTLRGTSTPVFDQDVVYAGFANGMVAALRADNGEPIWEQRVMLPEGRSELDRMVDVDGVPLVSGPLVYAAAYQGRVKAMRRADGEPLWEHEISSFLDLAEGYGHVYVVDDQDGVHAIDQQNAEVVWLQEGLARRQLSSPVAFSNYIAVGDFEGYLHILAQSDGRFLGRRKLGGKGVRSAMRYADGTLYALTNSGALYALEVRVK